jgi:sec-independent protein translocase protein TatA
MFGGVGGSEVLLIVLFVLVFFGSARMPEFARGFGKVMREFRKAVNQIKYEIENPGPPPEPRDKHEPPAG